MAQAQQTAAQRQQAAQAANIAARQVLSARGQRMVQQINSTTITPPGAGQNVLNIPPRNVGLIMGFWIQCTANVHNTTGGGTAITPTDFGAANLLSQISFTDLNNLIRVQTTGWHINWLNSIKGRFPYAMSLLNTALDGLDVAGSYGSNWPVIVQPASIADTVTSAVTMWYYLPIAYSDGDYRGSIFANVVNATMQLQLVVNLAPVTNANDTTFAVYQGGAGSISSITITVWQDYIDQIPMSNGGYVLPQMDLSTIYEIKNTTFSPAVSGNDFPMQYPNFRDFLSTFAVYNHDPTSTTGRNSGSDINYWALQAANLTQIFHLSPTLVALRSRALLHTDLPRGGYYFGSRNKPISTTQYGNMELVLNASTAAAGNYILIGWEDFGLQNIITQAGSLPAGG